MAALDRAGLLAALGLRFADVPLATGTARVRTLSAGERIDLFAGAVDDGGKIDNKRFAALLVEACVVDETGALVFGPGDTDALLGGASDVFEVLFEAAQRINGIGSKASETAAGN